MNVTRRLAEAVAGLLLPLLCPAWSDGRDDPRRPITDLSRSVIHSDVNLLQGGNAPLMLGVPSRASAYSDVLRLMGIGRPVDGAAAPWDSWIQIPVAERVDSYVEAEHFASRGDAKSVIDAYTEDIKERRNIGIVRYGRGVALHRVRDYEAAIADFSHAIELDPAAPDPYYQRADAWRQMTNGEKAIEDYDEFFRRSDARIEQLTAGIEVGPRGAHSDPAEVSRLEARQSTAYSDRGRIYRNFGDFNRARDDFQSATNLGRDYPRALAIRAWFLATCPDARYRNGRAAVAAAKRACELSRSDSFAYLSTLAAAHAESGDFSEAIRLQRRALQLATDGQEPGGIALLCCFLTRRAIREPVTVDVLYGRRSVRWFLGLGFTSGQGPYFVLTTNIAPAIHIYPRRRALPSIDWSAPPAPWEELRER